MRGFVQTDFWKYTATLPSFSKSNGGAPPGVLGPPGTCEVELGTVGYAVGNAVAGLAPAPADKWAVADLCQRGFVTQPGLLHRCSVRASRLALVQPPHPGESSCASGPRQSLSQAPREEQTSELGLNPVNGTGSPQQSGAFCATCL